MGDLILEAFLEGDGEDFFDPGRKFFLEDLGETGLFGGEGLRSFLEIFFDDLGDTKYKSSYLVHIYSGIINM